MSIRDLIAKARRYRAEILTSLGIMLGWGFLTSAVAEFARAGVVWRVSAGLFLLSLSGWRLLLQVASKGLYNLTRERRG